MPIEKVRRDERIRTQVSFGTGDVIIATGREQEENHFSMVILIPDQPKPIEEWKKQAIEPGEHDLPEDSVYLKFSRVESIDILIEKLKEVRRSIFNRQAPVE